MTSLQKLKAAVLRRISYKKANVLLAVFIVFINLYVVALPLLPKAQLAIRKQQTKAVGGLPYKTNTDTNSSTNAKRAEIPKENRVVIPKIALNELIYEGTSPYLVHKGVWARPESSTPPEGSNTVLVGHRFTYGGPATFYSLDKVAVGDPIVMYWNGVEYDYTVTETKVVAATAVEIEDPTKDSRLTIYTCTPLWSAKDRLVVVAKKTGEAHD